MKNYFPIQCQNISQIRKLVKAQLDIGLKNKYDNFEDIKQLLSISQQAKSYFLGFYFCKQIIIQADQIDESLSEIIDLSLKNILEPLRKSLQTLDQLQEQLDEDIKNQKNMQKKILNAKNEYYQSTYQKQFSNQDKISKSITDQLTKENKFDIIQEVRFDVYMDLTQILNLRNQINQKLEQISDLKDDFTILYLMKLYADFLRYSVEYTHGQIKSKLMKDCDKMYQQSFNFAKRKFSPIHHLRLGLILNKAIFVKRHSKDLQRATRILQDCVNEKEKYLEQNNECIQQKSIKIIRLINLNLKEWSDENTKQQIKNIDEIYKQLLNNTRLKKVNQNLKFLLKQEFDMN